MANYRRHHRIPVDGDQSLHVVTLGRDDQEPTAVFVFSHGFGVDGTESGRHFLELAELLVARRYGAILFDYRGSGYSDMDFAAMTLDSETADLQSALNFAIEEFPGVPLGVWGESFGAAVAARTLASHPVASAAVLWSLSADLYPRYRARLGDEIDRLGYTYTSTGLKVNESFLESLKGEDTFESVRSMRIPTLLVHGTADDVASVQLSREAHEVAPDYTVLVEVVGGNHGFEAQPEQFATATTTSLSWIDAQFRNGMT